MFVGPFACIPCCLYGAFCCVDILKGGKDFEWVWLVMYTFTSVCHILVDGQQLLLHCLPVGYEQRGSREAAK